MGRAEYEIRKGNFLVGLTRLTGLWGVRICGSPSLDDVDDWKSLGDMSYVEDVGRVDLRRSGAIMSDISKCHGLGCPVRVACHRFTASCDGEWQSYLTPRLLYVRGHGIECKDFMEADHGKADQAQEPVPAVSSKRAGKGRRPSRSRGRV